MPRLRFSLRTLLVVVTVLGFWLSQKKMRAVRRQAFKTEIEAAGGEISCRYQFGDSRDFLYRATWLSSAMGDPGPMTTVILPNAAMLERAQAIYPESTIWMYDSSGTEHLWTDLGWR